MSLKKIMALVVAFGLVSGSAFCSAKKWRFEEQENRKLMGMLAKSANNQALLDSLIGALTAGASGKELYEEWMSKKIAQEDFIKRMNKFVSVDAVMLISFLDMAQGLATEAYQKSKLLDNARQRNSEPQLMRVFNKAASEQKQLFEVIINDITTGEQLLQELLAIREGLINSFVPKLVGEIEKRQSGKLLDHVEVVSAAQ